MKVVIQRCSKASCIVDGITIGEIDQGFVIFVGFTHTDEESDLEWMAKKIVKLRIFEDENQKMNKSIIDVSGSILSISQFTLFANPYSGNRPSFTDAASPDAALNFYNLFNNLLREQNIQVETGSFGDSMKISLINDGPVTIMLDSKR